MRPRSGGRTRPELGARTAMSTAGPGTRSTLPGNRPGNPFKALATPRAIASEGHQMTATSRIAGRLLKLRPAATHRVTVERSIAVPMRDGVTLVTDRYVPAGAPAPIVLIRSPYGRGG